MIKLKALLNKGGAVLLMTLTLMSVLFVIILSLNASVSMNFSGTTRFLKQIQVELLLNAGLEEAFWHIKDQVSDNPFDAIFSANEQTLIFTEPQGTVIYETRDEESRFNLLRAEKNLISRALGFDDPLSESLLQIIKEKGPGAVLRLSNNFLIKMGFPVAQKDDGQSNELDELFTVWGDGRINVNSATERVLALIPGLTAEIAGSIIKFREENRVVRKNGRSQRIFAGPADLIGNKLLPAAVYDKISPWIKFESNYYSIKATAYLGAGKSVLMRAKGVWIVNRENSQVKSVVKRVDNG